MNIEKNELNSDLPPEAGGTGEFEALQAVIKALQPFPDEIRKRIFGSAATFLGIEGAAIETARGSAGSTPGHPTISRPNAPYPSFSTDTSMSPKEFLLAKQPRTDVERVACLAYYLTHYQETPHFKTLDLSKLNTEAAQPKFSNAADAANNAVKRGYLVASTKGQRQLSAPGELFVQALPDREAARAAMTAARPRRRTKRPKPRSGN